MIKDILVIDSDFENYKAIQKNLQDESTTVHYAATIQEGLHKMMIAIMDAINATRGSRRQMIPYFLEQLKQTYTDHKTDELDIDQMEKQIEQLKASTMELVQESVLSNTVGENVLRLKAMNDEIKGLSDLITEYKKSKDCSAVLSVTR